MDIDEEWIRFQSHSQPTRHVVQQSVRKELPECDPLIISTKTQIIYLNLGLDLNQLFWYIPMVRYDSHEEGVIKKQMKFNFVTREEVATFEENLAKETKYHKVSVLNQIDNPNGRIVFKDIRKVDIGICKNDVINTKNQSKSAFYNCLVIIYRIYLDDKYKEIHLKLFNSGKIEIPGVQNDEMVEVSVKALIKLIQPYTDVKVSEVFEKRQTILINSNFSCNYYLNRELLFNILKSKYHIKCSYDPCSYPGIQCKYKLSNSEVSFMIFRTGSILIVGKCETSELFIIYEFIKNILQQEFHEICEENSEVQPKKIKRKIKKILYIEKGI